MKGYLFGLGAMLVGAGLMFVLMHGEVSADVEEEIMHCKRYKAAKVDSWTYGYCEINDLICVDGRIGTLSCVKK